MRRIAIIGSASVGKSTLVSEFAKFLSKNGCRTKCINLDPSAENLRYAAEIDVRDFYDARKMMRSRKMGVHGATDEIYSKAEKNQKLISKINSETADYKLIDTAGSMDLFLFNERANLLLNKIADFVIFVCDFETLEEEKGNLQILKTLNAIQKLRYSLPTITVINKIDSERRGKAKIEKGSHKAISEHLQNLMDEIGKNERIIRISAKRGKGFCELQDALNELGCECGDLS